MNKKVFGTISWLNEDDRQDFVFNVDFSDLIINKIKLLFDFLFKKRLIDGDKIITIENDLLKMLKKKDGITLMRKRL